MARWYRARLARLHPDRQKSVSFGRGDISALNDDGHLLAVVDEILDLVAARDATLNLGYVSYAEMLAVSDAAARHGVKKVVLTSPLTSGGLTQDEVDALMANEATLIELTAYSMYPGRLGGADIDPAGAARLIRHAGVARCVLSSDGGRGIAASAEILPGAVRAGGARVRRRGAQHARPTNLPTRGVTGPQRTRESCSRKPSPHHARRCPGHRPAHTPVRSPTAYPSPTSATRRSSSGTACGTVRELVGRMPVCAGSMPPRRRRPVRAALDGRPDIVLTNDRTSHALPMAEFILATVFAISKRFVQQRVRR